MKSKVRTLFKCVNLTPLNQVVVSRVSQFSLSMALIYLVLGNVTINLNLEQGGGGCAGPLLSPRPHPKRASPRGTLTSFNREFNIT